MDAGPKYKRVLCPLLQLFLYIVTDSMIHTSAGSEFVVTIHQLAPLAELVDS